MKRFAWILTAAATIACFSAAGAEARTGLHLSGHLCSIIGCITRSTPTITKAAAAKEIEKFEASAPTPVTIKECRHDRKLVVCFLSRPYDDPENGIVAVEWWDCVGPRKIVTTTFKSERCQWAAYRAFPELRSE